MDLEAESQPQSGKVSFDMEPSGSDGGPPALRFGGELLLKDAPALWRRLRRLRRVRQGRRLNLDMSRVDRVDGGAMAILVHFRAELLRRGARCDFVGAKPQVQELIKLYHGEDERAPRPVRRRRPRGLLDQIGGSALTVGVELRLVLAFIGEIAIASVRALRVPKSVNWKEVPPIAERAGADGVPIVVLINFLLGMVIALQSEQQLRRFGAEIYSADLVGLSVAREIGPLMSAIILSGRTGAAFAAELGSMAINEEIDALRTMGFDPMRFLVLPRMLALFMIAPLLTIIADLFGGFGGMLVGVWRLDLGPAAYLTETHRAVKLGDIMSGLLKSMAFGTAIALIACQQGLSTRGGAEGLGRRTTSAVVTTLFSLILIDAVFTFAIETLKKL